MKYITWTDVRRFACCRFSNATHQVSG